MSAFHQPSDVDGDIDRFLSNDLAVTSLTIDGISVWREVKQALVAALRTNTPSLASLTILSVISAQDEMLLEHALESNTTLKALTVMDGGCVRAVSRALKVNKTIKSLTIDRYANDMTRDMVLLADALSVNTTLEVLRVGCGLEGPAAARLAEVLQDNSQSALTSVVIESPAPKEGEEDDVFYRHNLGGVAWAPPDILLSIDKAVMRNRDVALKRFLWHLCLIQNKSACAGARKTMNCDHLRNAVLDAVRHEGATLRAARVRPQFLNAGVSDTEVPVIIEDSVRADPMVQEHEHQRPSFARGGC